MAHNTDRTAGLATMLTIVLFAGLTACAAARTPAQSPAITVTRPADRTAQASAQEREAQEEARERGATGPTSVWDGVYTAEQAAKGRDIYRRVCAECHGTGEAPAIVGNSFIRRWFDDGLDVPFTKIRRTMPDDAPGTMPEESYLDVLSYMLESAGLPAGAEPLTAESSRLSAIKVVEQGGAVGAVPNFSLVQVMGCLMQSADGAWALTNSTNPLRTREPGNSTAAVLEEIGELPLGTQTFQLPTVQAQHLALKGHKVQAKGILMRNPAGDRLNLTTVQSLSDRCTP